MITEIDDPLIINTLTASQGWQCTDYGIELPISP
jgi:hypothetical protein